MNITVELNPRSLFGASFQVTTNLSFSEFVKQANSEGLVRKPGGTTDVMIPLDEIKRFHRG